MTSFVYASKLLSGSMSFPCKSYHRSVFFESPSGFSTAGSKIDSHFVKAALPSIYNITVPFVLIGSRHKYPLAVDCLVNITGNL